MAEQSIIPKVEDAERALYLLAVCQCVDSKTAAPAQMKYTVVKDGALWRGGRAILEFFKIWEIDEAGKAKLATLRERWCFAGYEIEWVQPSSPKEQYDWVAELIDLLRTYTTSPVDWVQRAVFEAGDMAIAEPHFVCADPVYRGKYNEIGMWWHNFRDWCK